MPTPRTHCTWQFACLLALAALPALASACGSDAAFEGAPPRLADTALFADAATRTVAADALSFEPQYPLWTDGARKRRWITLPAGTSIDASDPDHWQFPIGTRLWKEFTFASGVETRFMQRRADGTWLYATYVRTADGRDDVLAPDTGMRRFCATEGGKHHDVPAIADCRACHEATRSPVLGFSALQLSSDRDPLAPNATKPPADAVDLRVLIERDLVRGLPAEHAATPPRIAARSATERAALGYLHGNCANCHNASGPLQRLGLRFDVPLAAARTRDVVPAIATTFGVPSVFTRGDATLRVTPGAPEHSTLYLRVAAADPLAQMPPLGRHLVDRVAAELLAQWIRTDLPATAPVPDPEALCKDK